MLNLSFLRVQISTCSLITLSALLSAILTHAGLHMVTMPPAYFGTHPLGTGSCAACGVTQSPHIVSICMRANWKMPIVMNCYLSYENAGDQYVDRCASDHTRTL